MWGRFKYQGEIYNGAHPPIVPNSLFEQVQRIHKQRSGGQQHHRRLGKTASSEGLACEQARLADSEAQLNRLLDI